MQVQAVIFDKKKWTNTGSLKYIRVKKIRPIKPRDVTKNFIRYRIKDPKLFKKSSFRTLKRKNGIQFIVGKLE